MLDHSACNVDTIGTQRENVQKLMHINKPMIGANVTVSVAVKNASS